MTYIENIAKISTDLFPTQQKFNGGSRISQRRGGNRWGGRQPITWPIFPKNCMKMKKILPPAKSATDNCIFLVSTEL